jgi:hypothetical protein
MNWEAIAVSILGLVITNFWYIIVVVCFVVIWVFHIRDVIEDEKQWTAAFNNIAERHGLENAYLASISRSLNKLTQISKNIMLVFVCAFFIYLFRS